MRHVVLVSTGGTIASRFDRQHGDVRAGLSGADLMASIGTLPEGVTVSVEDFASINSFSLDLETAFRLCGRIRAVLARDEVAGVVVTHGTDTMEETAFMADLVVGSPKPVVFTGAQRTAEDPDPDGPRNLRAGIAVAASPLAERRGVLVVFGEAIQAARDATKTHTSRLDTFRSGEHGGLGEVDGAAVVFHRSPVLRLHVEASRIEPNVDLIASVMGMDGRFVRCSVEHGAKGLVLAAFGRGNVTPGILGEIRQAIAAGIPVLVTSRCPQGRVAPVYGNGGGKDLAEAGAFFAGDLSGPKARILLAVLLGQDPGARNLPAALAALAG